LPATTKNDSTKILAKDSIVRSNCYWFVHSEMFITEEHYVTYIHLLLVYYSVFNAIYIVVDLLDYNRM